jgi:hypothetical protein
MGTIAMTSYWRKADSFFHAALKIHFIPVPFCLLVNVVITSLIV